MKETNEQPDVRWGAEGDSLAGVGHAGLCWAWWTGPMVWYGMVWYCYEVDGNV